MLTNEAKEKNWIEFIDSYFKDGIPETHTWIGHHQIAEQLNKIGFDQSKAYNHTFLPGGGGLDLHSATVSSFEEGCIEMSLGSLTYIVKPKSLTFNSYTPTVNVPKHAEYEWFYFRLEVDKLKPSGVYDDEIDYLEDPLKDPLEDAIKPPKRKFSHEELVRLPHGELISRSYWDAGYYGHDENGYERPLPRDTKLVMRELDEGAFVIFGKFSIYNQTSGTYDGRHNKMNSSVFRNHIEQAMEHVHTKN